MLCLCSCLSKGLNFYGSKVKWAAHADTDCPPKHFLSKELIIHGSKVKWAAQAVTDCPPKHYLRLLPLKCRVALITHRATGSPPHTPPALFFQMQDGIDSWGSTTMDSSQVIAQKIADSNAGGLAASKQAYGKVVLGWVCMQTTRKFSRAYACKSKYIT